MSHDRTIPHFGFEPDLAIVLAAALEGLDEEDLHEVLLEMEAHIEQLEDAPHFSLNAVLV